MSFNKVTPDLEDPRQNEFVQDYLTVFQRQYNKCTGVGDDAAIDSTIDQLQEIYRPPQVPCEVQVKQHRIEQLEAHIKCLENEPRPQDMHTIRLMTKELADAHQKISRLEGNLRDADIRLADAYQKVHKLREKLDRSVDILQEHE